MTFKVIDTKTGKEPTNRVIDNIAKKGGLMVMDIDQFFVGEDGSLILVDDCGNSTYCDATRFKVVAESEDKEEINPYEKCKTCGQDRASCCGCQEVLELERKKKRE